jgi:uncharacterized protein YndB with AHSA1/START domain
MIHTGYLLIADISGYTAFLTQSELDHANPILRALLGALVEQVGDPLHLWRMEGDAVLAYTTDAEFPTGEAFLTICESLYNAFAAHRQNIIANTTCVCTACANVCKLDLKILAHYGQFEQMKFGHMIDISGPDVILVHRMAKTDVKEVTGINSYAMFTHAALDFMQIPREAVVDYDTSFEHFGEVHCGVYDLAAAWERQRAKRERHFLTEEDGFWTKRHMFRGSPQVIWQALTDPTWKRRWMMLLDVKAYPDAIRLGSGTRYHCVHEAMEFGYTVTDWEPVQYFSTRCGDPMHDGCWCLETYEFVPVEGGVEVRYTMSEVYDEEGTLQPGYAKPIADFLDGFWEETFTELDRILAERASAKAPAGDAAATSPA